MVESRRRDGREESRAELRAWYLERLGPRLERAAQTGRVEPIAAVALDAELRRLFALPSRGERRPPAGARSGT